MHKILFTEFAELKQGDGKGPKFFAGKAYWLSADQAVRWKAEGVAIDAPAEMVAENDRGPEPLRPEYVKIRRVRGGLHHVYGPNDYRFTQDAVSAGDAEKLRQRILNGEVKMQAAEEVEAKPEPITAIERPVEIVSAPASESDADFDKSPPAEPKHSLGFFHEGEDHLDA